VKSFLFAIAILLSTVSFAQEVRQEDALTTFSSPDSIFHSPKRATIFSAALPGLGQAYNKQYWKIPIVYAGLGTAVYFIVDNTKNFKNFREQLLFEIDGDPLTINTSGGNEAQLREVTQTYRRWRDWSYIAVGAIYGLQILDANVSAHLFYFDVDDDLSLMWHPSIPAPSTAGLTLRLTF